MVFFSLPYGIVIIGWIVHVFADRKPDRRTGHRVLELFLIWWLATQGFFTIMGGIFHLTGLAHQLAVEIGYAPSMFQWEVGWADIAVGVLAFGCIWKRDSWMTAAVVAYSLALFGDGIGHVMQYSAHHNVAPDNLWAIPTCFLVPLVAIVCLIFYRRGQKKLAAGPPT